MCCKNFKYVAYGLLFLLILNSELEIVLHYFVIRHVHNAPGISDLTGSTWMFTGSALNAMHTASQLPLSRADAVHHLKPFLI